MAGLKQLQNLKVSAQEVNSSIVALHVLTVDPSGDYVSPVAGTGSSQVSIKEILSSSGGSLIDSTNVSLAVTIREGGGAGVQYTDGDSDATITGTALMFGNSTDTMRPVTILRGLPVNLVTRLNFATDSIAVVAAAANNLATVYQSSAADLQATVRQNSTTWAVQMTQYSTTAQVSSVGGVVTVQQNSTAWQVQLSSVAGRVLVDQNSTTWPVQVSSVAGVVTAQQNSTTWAVQLSNYSTTAQVSSVGGRVLVDQNSTTWPVQVSSVAGKVLVDQNSTVWQVQVSSLAGSVSIRPLAAGTDNVIAIVTDNLGQSIHSSTRAVGTNSTMRGLAVRQILPDSTYASGQASSAGDNIIISSQAGTGIYVYALTFSPISTATQLIRLLNGSTAEMWRTRALAPSTMADQTYACQIAVSPPAYLFRTAAANPLILNVTSSGVGYSVSAWRE